MCHGKKCGAHIVVNYPLLWPNLKIFATNDFGDFENRRNRINFFSELNIASSIWAVFVPKYNGKKWIIYFPTKPIIYKINWMDGITLLSTTNWVLLREAQNSVHKRCVVLPAFQRAIKIYARPWLAQTAAFPAGGIVKLKMSSLIGLGHDCSPMWKSNGLESNIFPQ